ncbi:MAG: PQQ-binding-like beta-propeller repeat protein [Planctomycetes bacterium]|nr:PQQ-binding-like beta-propeller repeat protein [Planctomycetota bacterium]
MRRFVLGTSGLLVGLGLLLLGTPARGLITKPLSLKAILDEANHVCVVKIESVDPERPAMVLLVDADLKGKLPPRRLPVNLKGDSEGQKLKHPPQLLKRFAKDLPVVLFMSQKPNRFVGFGFSNGTWFQLLGRKDTASDRVSWMLTHGEPYLRRTFKGTTAEMRQLVEGVLKGTVKAPEPNLKEEPGFGPEVKPSDEKGSASGGRGPLFAVMPTAVIGAPLALLAMLFPAVMAGMKDVMRRWKVLLAVVSLTSTLLAVYLPFFTRIRDSWWGRVSTFWLVVTAITLVGAFWAWRRNLMTAPSEDTTGPPRRGEKWALGVLGGLGLVAAVAMWFLHEPFTLGTENPAWRYLALACAGFWVGGLYVVLLQLTAHRRAVGHPVLPTEGVILWTMVGACVLLTTGRPRSVSADTSSEGQKDLSGKTSDNPALRKPLTAASTAGLLASPHGRSLLATSLLMPKQGLTPRGASLLRQVWKFEAGDKTDIASSPVVAGNRVYIGVITGGVFEKRGLLYCLDRETGKKLWQFDNDEEMKQMLSSPCVAYGRVYVGEGFHENASCKLFCLDAATGKKLWAFETQSHVESSPCVADGRLYFGAGDDGLYCLDAGSGKKLWQYPGPGAREGLHIDANPTVVDGRVYCGSGMSRTYRKLQVFCLDAKSGAKIWARDDLELPAWGSPAVAQGRAYFGLGNGRLTMSDEKDPRGAVLCLDAQTGKRIWLHDRSRVGPKDGIKDGVFTRPIVDRHHVYVASRDGNAYGLDRRNGEVVWKRDLGSPSVSSPALARCTCCGASSSLYVAATGGTVRCLDPDTGEVFWTFDKMTDDSPILLSSLAVEVRRTEHGDRRRLYVAAGVNGGTNSVVYCLEDQWHEGAPEE